MENIQITKKMFENKSRGYEEKYGFNSEKYFLMSLKNST